MSDFPVLDAPRGHEFGRGIFDYFGEVEPYITETDSWIAMPVRLVHDQLAGWHLEVGPYALDRNDIQRLREAIAAFDLAVGVPQ